MIVRCTILDIPGFEAMLCMLLYRELFGLMVDGLVLVFCDRAFGTGGVLYACMSLMCLDLGTRFSLGMEWER
jgi:hypothetical protein